MYGYRLHLEPDDNGTILVTCPSISELATFGENTEDALRNANAALDEALAGRIARGVSIPDPDGHEDDAPGLSSYAMLRSQSALKVELYQALEATKVTRAELSRRLGWHREQVDRLFRLDHASRLDQMEAAAQALGFQINLELAPA